MEVLVDPYKSYQLYYRDPATRKFVALQTNTGKKYQVIFDTPYFNDDYVRPETLELTDMMPGSSKMYSRKFRVKEWDIKFLK